MGPQVSHELIYEHIKFILRQIFIHAVQVYDPMLNEVAKLLP